MTESPLPPPSAQSRRERRSIKFPMGLAALAISVVALVLSVSSIGAGGCSLSQDPPEVEPPSGWSLEVSPIFDGGWQLNLSEPDVGDSFGESVTVQVFCRSGAGAAIAGIASTNSTNVGFRDVGDRVLALREEGEFGSYVVWWHKGEILVRQSASNDVDIGVLEDVAASVEDALP